MTKLTTLVNITHRSFLFSLLFVGLGVNLQASCEYTQELTVEPFEAGNKLSWTTANEKNCEYFLLEKSKNGLVFERVAILKGGMNSDQERAYTYLDTQNQSLRIFYRLIQVDLDGTGDFSHVVVLSKKEENSPFVMKKMESSITNRHFHLTLQANDEANLEYRLMTNMGDIELNGKEALTKGMNTVTLDFGNVAVGTYQLALKVKNDIEVIAVRKVDNNTPPKINLAIKSEGKE